MPIAICGMGMRLPGGIRDSGALYDFLLSKRDARGNVPSNRFNVDGFYDAEGKPGTLSSTQGYWLDDVDLSNFDSSLFSMGRKEIENLDPHQRLLLEVVREAFESAAETGWRGKNIGCYAASFGEEWSNLHAKDSQNRGFNVITGYMDLMQANRISYEFDLRGPSMTLRVGCSGSGLGIHLACQSIQLGECSSAIVAGANIILSPETTMLMADGGAISPDASSKTFDASANGYVRADGINCLYIKRLDEAIRDGNPIRAVIRGTSTNAGGKSTALTAPNIQAEETLIKAAYRNAGVDPARTAMVECHGTGTAMGDAIEADAVARVFGDKGIYIGAVKPNLGHSEGASAISSVMKAIVELEHRTILPNIKFNTPSPRIRWDEARLTVPTEPMQWPEDREERISINSYGIGGTNVHIILDSATSFGLSESDTKLAPEREPDFKLLMLSAGHSDSLKEMQKNYEEYATKHPDRLTDLAYTLAERREHLPVRGFCVSKGNHDEVVISPSFTSQPQKNVAFVFTGQGAQWAGMGKELLETCPELLHDIRQMDKLLQKQKNPPVWSIEEQLSMPPERSLLSKAEVAQPVCTALQIALCNHLARWEVFPSAVVGHSSGEIAAAYAAGSLNMHDAVLLAYYRGVASKEQTREGAMAAVGLGYDEVVQWLHPGVVIACENSPSSVTLSGDADAIESVLSAIRSDRPDAFQRLLKVNKAYHSHHMQDVGHLYDSLITNQPVIKRPKVPFHSTVFSRQLYEAEEFGSSYWRLNMESPVWFYQGFNSLLQSEIGKDALYLEIGPHSALAGPIKQIYRAHNAPNSYLSVLSRGSNAVVTFLSCVGELWSRGVNITYPFTATTPKALHDLPLYPWHYAESWWSESRLMKSSRFQKFPHHELLGVRTIESSDLEPAWRNVLRLGDVSWLRDHCVGPDIVFPAAAYVAMVGHAIWQITDQKDFTVRDVSLKTAMVLDENVPTEIITRLLPHRLTDSLNSTFFEFSVQSYTGSVWAQHCVGLVAGGQHSPGQTPTVTSFSRIVESKRWYRAMSRAGLRYGPHFTGLEQITASVTESTASAIIPDSKHPGSPYTLHPTTIDLILQSAFVAMYQGQPSFFEKFRLPTFIEEMYIRVGMGGQDIHLNTAAQEKAIQSHGVVTDDLVFFMNGLEFSAPEKDETEQDQQSETAQLVWKPDIHFVDPTTLVKPAQQAELLSANPLIERIFLLCIIDLMEDIKAIPTTQPHLGLYRTWMSEQLAQAQKEGSPLVPDAKELFNLSASDRKELIQSLVASHTEGTMLAGSRILFLCYRHMLDIFKGNTNPLELMRRDGLLGRYYDCLQDKHDYKDFLQLLSHLRPRMNVLEIGAGTGGLTAKVLDFLRSESGEDIYREYMYTDISSGFFVNAQERFHDRHRIRYDVLDISKDPIEQGFPEAHYDLVIASNILHATPKLTETLKHTKRLLKPDGRLLLQELCPASKWTNFIFGLFPGWWLGKDDGRPSEPYISPTEWNCRLRAAGFTGVDVSALDAEYPYQLNTMLIATPAPLPYLKKVTVLYIGTSAHPLIHDVHQQLSSDGYKVDLVGWGDNLPADQDIVFLLDLEAPFFDNITKENLDAFLQVFRHHSSSKFLWITHAAQILPQDPRFSQVLGMARTLRSELGVSFSTLEMESFGPGSTKAISILLQHIQQRAVKNTGESEFDPDQEYAWANDEIQVSRMHWISIPKALAQSSEGSQKATLEIGRPGLLNTLRWVSQPMNLLGANEVRIKTMSLSMNFKELLLAMGVVPIDEGQVLLGTDSAGIVTEVGPNVKNVSAGDRVMALTVESTSYTTVLQISSHLCIRIPDDCSFEEASTLPTVYLTVLRTLKEKANLRRGQSTLIHSAAGGVGIAAIHYAKSVGAKIYATVSSPKKTDFLVDKMGVARQNIFYSRDNSFLHGVMKATCGRGVDVVLNSLSGEQLHASWQCVTEGGTMVEIGKRDLLGRGKLSMSPFLANRSYIGVDIATLAVQDPVWVQEQLAAIVNLYRQGIIHPIHPVKAFPINKVEDAFRYLQTGQHIGKLVLQFSDSPNLSMAPRVPLLDLRGDRTYLLVGGMRGIGASIARWMVYHGARNLVFLSRSAGERHEDKALVRELSDMGCQVLTFAGDIANMATVQRVVSSVRAPIAGVIQLAMVLADTGVMKMDLETWNAAIKPKVDGTWNLHKALPMDMNFFVMASSLSGTFGNYGQSNYAAANTFLDAFAQFRQSQGLAASVLDLGVVDEIGFVSRNASIHRAMVQQMSAPISESSLLNSFHLAIIRSHPLNGDASIFNPLEGFRSPHQLLHGLLSKSGIAKSQFMWQRDPRTALNRIHTQKDASTSDGDDRHNSGLKSFLADIHDNPGILQDQSSAERAATEIARQVSIYTTRRGDEATNLKLSLHDFGVDSLVSIELRNWWKQSFGVDVTVLQLMNGGSFRDLGKKAVDQLKKRHLKA
ncbi:hypothetical protein BDV27DRAFT_157797 [Aspergillus caelatus]|uniref:Polyketide synthase n=1 Tax=Aspergillus caelatus TaxID=61420 RepID=A0A5N7A3P7_9EURO|nr:uncharacterized protein BDV27DRAFT_157797 [Aspergillus caelatus]KAE8364491.1 hypothetical protein BDV27DRAFT_157797 [Aspergillus caelatus]